MAEITDYLKKILSSVYGKDVRQSIHDAIRKCYMDGKAGAIDLIARERIDTIVANNNSTSENSELIDIRVGSDGKTYATAGTAVREQIKKITDNIASTPDNIMNVHVWEKFSPNMTVDLAESDILAVTSWVSMPGISGSVTIKYGSSVGMSNGSVTVAEPYSTMTYKSNSDSITVFDVLKGKYAVINNVCYKIGENAKFSLVKEKNNYLEFYKVKCDDAKEVKAVKYSASYGHITSSNKKAYPIVGASGDYRYEYKGTIGQALSKIEAISNN